MSRKLPVSKEEQAAKIPMLVADWRTGEFTQRDLAHKYQVSNGFVAKHTKGVEQDAKELVSKMVEAKQELALFDEQTVSAVSSVVEDRTKHIQFFNNAAIANVRQSMSLPCESQNDYRARADTILKGRETVLGKSAETQVNVQNNVITKIERVIVKANHVG